MRYSIKDQFGNVSKFGKNELIEAARNGQIDSNTIIHDDKYNRSATAGSIPQLQEAFQSRATGPHPPSTPPQAPPQIPPTLPQAPPQIPPQASPTNVKSRNGAKMGVFWRAILKNVGGIDFNRDLPFEDWASDDEILQKYGTFEIYEQIIDAKKEACETLNWRLFTDAARLLLLLLLGLFVVGLFVALAALAVKALDEALLKASDSLEWTLKIALLLDSIKGLAWVAYGFFCSAATLLFFIWVVPILWLIRYSQLTARRQAALIRLNELYKESKKIRDAREKDAA